MNTTTRCFPRRSEFKSAQYAGSIYAPSKALSVLDKLGYFLGVALFAGALSMAWWWK